MSMKTADDILKSVGSTAEFLFKEVTSVNQRSNFGDTPLHLTCSWGGDEAVDTLIKAGAEVNLRGEQGKTPLFSAVIGKSLKAIRILLDAHADPTIVDDDGITPAEFAMMLREASSFDFQLIIDLLNDAGSKLQHPKKP